MLLIFIPSLQDFDGVADQKFQFRRKFKKVELLRLKRRNGKAGAGWRQGARG